MAAEPMSPSPTVLLGKSGLPLGALGALAAQRSIVLASVIMINSVAAAENCSNGNLKASCTDNQNTAKQEIVSCNINALGREWVAWKLRLGPIVQTMEDPVLHRRKETPRRKSLCFRSFVLPAFFIFAGSSLFGSRPVLSQESDTLAAHQDVKAWFQKQDEETSQRSPERYYSAYGAVQPDDETARKIAENYVPKYLLHKDWRYKNSANEFWILHCPGKELAKLDFPRTTFYNPESMNSRGWIWTSDQGITP